LLVRECTGSHPLLSGGVLLPLLLRLFKVPWTRLRPLTVSTDATRLHITVAELVQRFAYPPRPMLLHFRPRIVSTATDRIAAATHNAHTQQAADASSMQRLDSN
jgi:hypothetical protein